MDLKTRKFDFIQEFFKLQSEEAILRFEQLLKEEKKKLENNSFKPMTMEEFHKRIDASIEDSKNGRLIEVTELLAEIETWS
ncbi:hypothetical protein [Mucilaginibacter arboris]|uniref:Uncharacterized protein n=1 Tax=Mucilaginibacter arboris TaxID=2682090 RepID=A0A7K1SS92_9SPHI|nr:hypothetical protein [Mucilaginibacter arboris]MVN20107.1 hypothetical protein [Mucilaginibacter arboris]